MTPKEAFKVGFLRKCANDGLTPDQTMQRIQQAKFMLKSSGIGVPFVAGLSALKALFGAAWPLALLGPPLVGLGGGAMLAKAQNDTFDPEDVKKREEASEYERALQRLRRLQQRQDVTGVR